MLRLLCLFFAVMIQDSCATALHPLQWMDRSDISSCSYRELVQDQKLAANQHYVLHESPSRTLRRYKMIDVCVSVQDSDDNDCVVEILSSTPTHGLQPIARSTLAVGRFENLCAHTIGGPQTRILLRTTCLVSIGVGHRRTCFGRP